MTGPAVGRLVRRLVDAGIVDAEAAMAGRVSVTDLSRSNQVSLVSVDGSPAAVVKRGTASVDQVEPVEAELAAYRWLGLSVVTADLAPPLLAALDSDAAMAVAPVVGAMSLHEALLASPGDGEDLLTGLGRLLGTLHAAPVARGPRARRPWVLGVPAGRSPAMFTGNEAAGPVLDRIRADRAIAAAIARLDATPRAIVHGDVKFDNVLVDRGGRLRLIDWELAGLGAPVWDLAGVVDGLLLPGLLGDGAATMVDRATVAHLAAPAVAGYRDLTSPSWSPDDLAVAVVARLAQTAVQLAAMTGERDGAADRILAAARNLAEETVVGRCPA